MEENEYRQTYHEVNQQRCWFEKAILSRRCQCHHAHKFCLAEREGISCADQQMQGVCHQFLQQCRRKAMFIFHLSEPAQMLPHAKEIRVQLGSLHGLQQNLDGSANEPYEDIAELLTRSLSAYDEVDNMPYETIIRSIQEMEARKKRRPRRKPGRKDSN